MKQDQFLSVSTPEEARARWWARLDLSPGATERVPLAAALHRVLARAVVAPGNVPAFDRSNVDGFAVRAEDTWGATEKTPRRLALADRSVDAGHPSQDALAPGQAMAIATGGVVPRGADAIVMVEDTTIEGERVVRVVRPAVPGGHVSAAGSDVVQGETVLVPGTLLTARETGTLAAVGIDAVEVHVRPRVAVFSTGDEIVAPGTPLAPGHVHDANATLLADAAREAGAEVNALGIVPDDRAALAARLEAALDAHDVVLLSGGTSKGGGDLSYRVVEERARIVVHGVALKPGKPLCLAAWHGKPVVVLPGFPTSAIFTFHAFVAPVLRRLAGRGDRAPSRTVARLPRRMTSEPGRAEFMLVCLTRGRDGLVAFPMGKGSGSVTTFARADGFFEVPASVEYVDPGAEVEVTLLGEGLQPADLVVVGSHCTGLDVVLEPLAARRLALKCLWVGSRGGVEAARLGACDVAPVHLYDRATGAYNVAFVPPGSRLLAGYGRRQGLVYRAEHENALGPAGVAEGADDALCRAAKTKGLVMANRNPASGTRALIEDLLAGALEGDARPAGWATGYTTHAAVAAAIAQGRADFGVALETVARAAGLCWRPLKDERYDFLVPEDRWDAPAVVAFRTALADPKVRDRLVKAGFSP